MFCKMCGTKNDDDAIFCIGCGNKISMTQSTEVNTDKDLSQETAREDEKIDEGIKKTTDEVVSEDKDNMDTADATENIGYSFFEKIDESENSQSKEDKTQYGTSQAVESQNQYDSGFTSNMQYDSQSDFQIKNQTESKKTSRFSVKRFIFSSLVIIVSILSCITIFMSYLTFGIKYSGEDVDTENQKSKVTGLEIIKEKTVQYDEDDEIEEYEDLLDISDKITYCVIALSIVMITFAVIELVLLTIVRRRWAYVLVMIFSLIKGLIAGYIGYLWCFEALDAMKTMFKHMLSNYFYEGYAVRITAGIGIGLILVVVAQVITFISSIVLMICKNRQKAVKTI